MTLFEVMCIGFIAGVVMTLIAILLGFIIDKGGTDEVQDAEGKQ